MRIMYPVLVSDVINTATAIDKPILNSLKRFLLTLTYKRIYIVGSKSM